jgi:hypothetical protein
MSKFNLTLFLSTILLSSLLQADMKEAEGLFNEAKCMECHNNEDFKNRPDKVSDYHKLQNSVNACSSSTDTGWFEEENEDVAAFLNHKFYHYKQPPAKEED